MPQLGTSTATAVVAMNGEVDGDGDAETDTETDSYGGVSLLMRPSKRPRRQSRKLAAAGARRPRTRPSTAVWRGGEQHQQHSRR